MNNFWQQYHFRLDPWGTDYDASIGFNPMESINHTVDPHVESHNWVAQKPKYAPPRPAKLLFVDGRRRLDARFLGREGDAIIYGAFATIAVGAVSVDCTLRQAACLPPVVQRAIALGGQHHAPATPIPCPLGGHAPLLYDHALTTVDNDAHTPLALVQKAMLQAEAQLAMTWAQSPNTLVIRDGPLLHQPYHIPQLTLGYVKTMGKAYLSNDYAKLLWQLRPGERTPIFAIHQSGYAKPHWSWYLRAGQSDTQRLSYHDLHGLVRLDLYCDTTLAQAKELADLTTYLIPEYASHPTRDARAPQNLTPIGALEKELGRYMGSKSMIERRLRAFLSA